MDDLWVILFYQISPLLIWQHLCFIKGTRQDVEVERIYMFHYYYYSWPFFVFQRREHIRTVVFHTLHIGQRYIILCPYLVYFATFYPLLFYQLRGYSVLTPPPFYFYSPSLSLSASAAAVSFASSRSIHACSHHLIPSCAPQFLSTASHRSRIVPFAIYCSTIFCLRQM